MNVKTMYHNANLLWNASESAIFNVDKEGCLSIISKWNLFGRLIKWIRDYDGEWTVKIKEAVKETFETIATTNSAVIEKASARAKAKGNVTPNQLKPLVYVHDQGKGFISIFFDAKSDYSYYYPADLLVKKVKKNEEFSNVLSIRQAMSEVKQQRNEYPKTSVDSNDEESNRNLSWQDYREMMEVAKKLDY